MKFGWFVCGLWAASAAQASGAGASGDAPAQTVEGAQTFLSQVLPGVQVDVGGWMLKDRPINLDRFGAVQFVDASRRCQVKVFVSYEPMPYHHYLGRGKWETVRYGFFDPIVELNASRISEVRPKGRVVTLLMMDGKFTSPRLRSNSEAMAARIAYAFDFLRQQCDVTSATGF